jgi:ABC-2 type transport system ATP-binding protein
MEKPVLEVKNLTKKYGKFTAVNNISFEIGKGEILGLLGQNGAGKTTTIQMLLGATTPTSGEIFYFGNKFQKSKENILKQINYSSTYTRLPWRMTVWENLDVYARLYEIPNRKERILKILKIFEIENMLNKLVSSLSSGQNARLMLTKAFINYPKIILLDEPTAGLDPDIAIKVREFLKSEQKNFDVSMLFTSHNMAEVEEICDRVIFLHNGKIIAQDTPEGLAKTITDCEVELMITDGMKRTVSYCKKNQIPYNQKSRYIKIRISEKEIAELLTALSNIGIEYQEISIKKPELEDFFLSVTKKKKND